MNLFILLNTKDVLNNVGNYTVWVSLTSIVVVFSRRQIHTGLEQLLEGD